MTSLLAGHLFSQNEMKRCGSRSAAWGVSNRMRAPLSAPN